MVDADYCFTYIDVGGNGRASDSAIFTDCTLNISMENNTLGMPENSVIIGDDAFPLRTNLMKPYSKTGLSNYERIFTVIFGFPAREELWRMPLVYWCGDSEYFQDQSN
jgi:hypothetical protein